MKALMPVPGLGGEQPDRSRQVGCPPWVPPGAPYSSEEVPLCLLECLLWTIILFHQFFPASVETTTLAFLL